VKVYIQASSYLGADVSNAPMTLSWTVPNADGKINIVTGLFAKGEVCAGST